MMSTRVSFLLGAVLGAGIMLLTGCRGQPSPDPPIHLNLNMDFQDRYLPQAKSELFGDQRAMRPDVPGTVARGNLRDDDHLFRGLIHGQAATTLPIPLSRELLLRGRDRFNIYCAVCHDQAGTGEGLVVKKGMLPPPAYSQERLRLMPLGQIFETISHGVRNMPSYASQIPVSDRWAITSYVRALQLSQGASLKDIPQDIIEMKGWNK
jgi:mono/diheme cytochrome c family protein